MNSFYIPALAGQIYAMPGMQTALHAVINKAGVYEGFSANYSGAGFSDMKFKFHGMSQQDFDQWVATSKADASVLKRADYLQLEQPSIKDPVRHFGTVDADLFHAILNRCVSDDQVCMDQLMASDVNVKTAKNNEAKGFALLAQNQRNGRALDAEVCTTPSITSGKK